MKNHEEQYKTAIGQILHADKANIFLYWKGRVALYALLRAMNVGEDDEVIIPAFTCVVVANAIKYLGAKPIYVDIDPSTYNMDIRLLPKHITHRTKVILCQNTFGLSSNIEHIVKIAKENGLYTIEDCTHGFGGTYHGKPNGSFCDAAFYSTQWNKPFSTGIGGFALLNNEDMKGKLLKINAELHHPTAFNNLSLSLLCFIRENMMSNRLYWSMLKVYRWLSRNNLVQGSSSGKELMGTDMPVGYFKTAANAQIRKGIKNIRNFPSLLTDRKSNAKRYTAYLKNRNKQFVDYTFFEDHSFLFYPILVNDKKTVFDLAELRKVPLGDWFCSPIHPITGDFEKWDLNVADYPVAEQMSKRIVNLPTTPSSVEKIVAFLKEIDDYIL